MIQAKEQQPQARKHPTSDNKYVSYNDHQGLHLSISTWFEAMFYLKLIKQISILEKNILIKTGS